MFFGGKMLNQLIVKLLLLLLNLLNGRFKELNLINAIQRTFIIIIVLFLPKLLIIIGSEINIPRIHIILILIKRLNFLLSWLAQKYFFLGFFIFHSDLGVGLD